MSELKDKTNNDNEKIVDDDDDYEKEPEDLVTLSKKMHQAFYNGEINPDPNYKSAREQLRDYQENN